MEGAFARAEWESRNTALRVRLATLVVIQMCLLVTVQEPYMVFYHIWILVFLLLGAAQLYLMHLRIGRHWLAYLFATLDGLLIGALLLLPNPFLPEPYPPAVILRYANIIFVFVLLAGAALTYNPGLVLCTGLSSVIVWRLGVSILAASPAAITSSDPAWRDADGNDATLRLFFDPDFIHLGIENKKVLVVVMVTIILAAVVRRARRVVLRQVDIERTRTNLARYFSPNLVDELAEQDQPFGAVRRQSVAVLFADIQGFTSLSETMPPEEVVDLLRSFHQRMETAIFSHSGTLDKYIGDGVMATFGTPNPGEQDATNALLAARRMLAELDGLNVVRAGKGKEPLAMSIGIQYGPVVQGDIGGGRRLEFTVLGDTVNVASRLEAITRDLGTQLVVSSDLVGQLRLESDAPDLGGLVEREAQEVRGRAGRLGIWILAPTTPPPPSMLPSP